MSDIALKEKLENIRSLVDECLQRLDVSNREVLHETPTTTKKLTSTDDITLQIVNKVGDCSENESIQKCVLDKKGVKERILLCFYISHKYFKNAWLSSGDIEEITSDLGVKIDKRNASNYLKDLRQYLESGAVRERGQPTPYRLNRKGVQRFNEILHAKES